MMLVWTRQKSAEDQIKQCAKNSTEYRDDFSKSNPSLNYTGYCAIPIAPTHAYNAKRCESSTNLEERYANGPDINAKIRDRLTRKILPLCDVPQLLALTIDNYPHGDRVSMWPSFDSNFYGPYHVSLGNSESRFRVYARGTFVGVKVSLVGYDNNVVEMGNFSRYVDMTSNIVKVQVRVEFDQSVNVYQLVVSNTVLPNTIKIRLGCIDTTMQTAAYNYNSALDGSRGTRHMINTSDTHTTNNCFFNKFFIRREDAITTSDIKVYAVLSRALHSSAAIPDLNGTEWQSIQPGSEKYSVFNRPNCENMTVLVQYERSIISHYELLFPKFSNGFHVPSKHGLKTVVEITASNFASFCSAGAALEEAFIVSLLPGTNSLKIKLDSNPVPVQTFQNIDNTCPERRSN